MSINIFRFSSCRGINVNNISMNFKFHNIKEILFFLDLLDNKNKNNYIKNSLIENEDNLEEVINLLKKCDIIYVEISTLKYNKDEFGNIGQIVRINNLIRNNIISKNHFKDCYYLDDDELLYDIKLLENKLNWAKIVYTGHITLNMNSENKDFILSKIERENETNLQQIENKFNKIMESRRKINDFIIRYCKYYMIIEDVFKNYDCKEYLLDMVHYTEYGYKILHDKFQIILKQLS